MTPAARPDRRSPENNSGCAPVAAPSDYSRAAALWTLLAGNPFENFEMRWFGQILRWRYERGLAPPVDPSMVHVDVTQVDLRTTPTLELEYQNAANIIRRRLSSSESCRIRCRVRPRDRGDGRSDPRGDRARPNAE